MKKYILYSDDMIEDDDEEMNSPEEEEMNPPGPKKIKTDMMSKKFHWTEWDQKLEGDRVQGKSEL